MISEVTAQVVTETEDAVWLAKLGTQDADCNNMVRCPRLGNIQHGAFVDVGTCGGIDAALRTGATSASK